MSKRLSSGIVAGTLLGVLCVIGAFFRSDGSADANFFFSLWYNRVIIGLVIGAPWIEADRKTSLIRGGILGLMISFAFYATSGFQDPISFMMGIVYGVLIEEYFQQQLL